MTQALKVITTGLALKAGTTAGWSPASAGSGKLLPQTADSSTPLINMKAIDDAIGRCPIIPKASMQEPTKRDTPSFVSEPSPKHVKSYGVLEDIGPGELSSALAVVETPRNINLKPHEVEVRVIATAITEHDAQFAEGRFIGYLHMSAPGSEKQPYVPGFDCSGIVTNVGDKVKDFKVGQPVIGLALPGKGSWGSHVVTNDSLVYAKPDHLSFQQAAASATPFMVVSALLEAVGDVNGKRCLVIGASGNIGSMLTPALHHKGALITGVCSAKKADKVRQLGADKVIDYRASPLTEQLGDEKFDLIFDFAGGKDIVEQSKTLKAEKGRLLTTVGPEKQNGKTKLSLPRFAFMMNDIAFGVLSNQFTFIAPLSPDGDKIDENFFQDYRDSAKVAKEIDIDDMAGLHDAVDNLGNQEGRVVMVDRDAQELAEGLADFFALKHGKHLN